MTSQDYYPREAEMTQAAIVHHPGVILQRELEARHMRQKDLADKLGLSYAYINDLIHGRRSVSVSMAVRLEDLWGISAEMWLGMQMHYDLFMARKEPE